MYLRICINTKSTFIKSNLLQEELTIYLSDKTNSACSSNSFSASV